MHLSSDRPLSPKNAMVVTGLVMKGHSVQTHLILGLRAVVGIYLDRDWSDWG